MADFRAKLLLEGKSWNTSRDRSIDDATLVDLLGIVLYDADRATILEEIGFDDFGSPGSVLLDYVLDAIGAPREGEEKFLVGETERFSRQCFFRRERFYELVYGEFAVTHEGNDSPPAAELLEQLREEVRDNLRSYYV